MKRNNISHLIGLLVKQNEWITAGELAAQMHITTRSVRNYIAEINQDNEPPLILGSHSGYRWNSMAGSSLAFFNEKPEIPETPEDRCWFLIRKLLFRNTKQNSKGLSIDEICELLLISDSTLFNDTAVLRKFLVPYETSLHVRNEHYSLSGKESGLRHLLYDCIIHFISGEMLLLSDLEDAFPQYDPYGMKELITNSFSGTGLSYDSYHINGLILYLIVQIIRMSNNHLIKAEEVMIPDIEKSPDYQAANIITAGLESRFNISFTWWETYYLTILLICSCTNNCYDCSFNKQTLDDVKKCLDSLSRRENVRFDQNHITEIVTDFFERLRFRCRFHIYAANPLTASIRNTSPSEYNEAAWICTAFNTAWNISIPRDEIAWLTMILSGYIRTVKPKVPDINCTLICPDFFGSTKFMKDHLQSHFGSRLNICKIIDHVETNDIEGTEMKISVLSPADDHNCVWVTPQLTGNDYSSIQRKISSITAERRYNDFLNYLNSYSSKSFFERNHNFASNLDAISYTCGKLKAAGYIDDSFADQIILREKTDPTDYHNFIAVPHAIVKGVMKNSVYIILNDRPIKWGDRQINLIILSAMEHDLMQEFRHFYEILIGLFEDRKNMMAILNTKKYDDFVAAIQLLAKK